MKDHGTRDLSGGDDVVALLYGAVSACRGKHYRVAPRHRIGGDAGDVCTHGVLVSKVLTYLSPLVIL